MINRRARGRDDWENIQIFESKVELPGKLQCKLYKIDEAYGTYKWDHTHDYFQIWYVNKGEFLHNIDKRKYKMVKGNLFVIPPYAVHRIDLISGKGMEIIGCEFLPTFINDRFEHAPFSKDFFDFAYLERFLVEEDEEITPKIALSGRTDTEVRRLLDDMYTEYQQQDSYFELVLKGELLKLLAIIMREYNTDVQAFNGKLEKYRPAITATEAYIHEHYMEEINLELLCRQAMMSKTYFYILFKHFIGKTLNEYITELRVQKSTELLLNSDLSVTDVCFGVGFNNLTYFSRVFKKMTGIPPSHYKKYAQQ